MQRRGSERGELAGRGMEGGGGVRGRVLWSPAVLEMRACAAALGGAGRKLEICGEREGHFVCACVPFLYRKHVRSVWPSLNYERKNNFLQRNNKLYLQKSLKKLYLQKINIVKIVLKCTVLYMFTLF